MEDGLLWRMKTPPEAPPGYWFPPEETSALEKQVLKRLERTGRLFAFLRQVRHQLFDEAFQQELLAMYSDAPRGTPPKPPALLALVTLLQAYERKSDAAAVEEAVFDRRWQLVLDCMGSQEPPFSQGVLVDFRRRLVAHDMDRRLVERSVELARQTGLFGHKALKVALDSSPLWGAGRVEDTFNLIGHALEVVVDCAAAQAGMQPQQVRHQAGLKLVGHSSLKAALDIDWDDEAAQADALGRLLGEVERLRAWVRKRLAPQAAQPPLQQALALLERVITQDLEPDPSGGGRMRIRQGTAPDRRISVSDADMRHGRKSSSRVFNGYKRHLVRALDSPFLLAACARPANEPEAQAADLLRADVERLGEVAAMHVDRGYLNSDWAKELFALDKEVVCRPWPAGNRGLYPKTAFRLHLRRRQVTCPQGKVARIQGQRATFASADCDACPARSRCLRAKRGRGRSICIHPQEALMQRLRRAARTRTGRARLRERVAIEHSLAHLGRRQGPRARYRGCRMNTFDVRRTAAVENLHALDRLQRAV